MGRVRALNDYVIIRPNRETEVSPTGLYVPNTTTSSGVVVSVGVLCKSKVRPGDEVLLPKASTPSVIKVGDAGEVWVVPERVIMAVTNDGESNGS